MPGHRTNWRDPLKMERATAADKFMKGGANNRATEALRHEALSADTDSRSMVFGSDRTSPKRYPSSGLPKTKFE